MSGDSYIVSFIAGSSGKFLSMITHRMINESSEPIEFTPFNAAHIGIDPEVVTWLNDEYNRSNIYKDIQSKPKGSLPTHMFPNFDDVRENKAILTVILVRPSISDCREIAHNSFVKNNDTSEMHSALLNRHELELVNSANRPLNNIYPFFNTPIPNDLINTIHEINYSDIFKKIGDSYVALEQLKEITSKDIHPNVFGSYKTYVNNRNLRCFV